MFEHEHYEAKIHLKIGVIEKIGCLTVWHSRCQCGYQLCDIMIQSLSEFKGQGRPRIFYHRTK